MNKVVVLYSGGRQWGGIETYLANLFRLYDRGKVELILASLGDWELSRAVGGPEVEGQVRVLSGKRVRPRTVFDLRRLLVDEGAALLVSQGTVANAYARAAAMLGGLPHLTVIHSDTRLDYPRPLVRWAFALSDRLLRRATKRYITVSGRLKEQLVSSGVRGERVRVIYNGVDVVGRPPSAQTSGAGAAAASERRTASGAATSGGGRSVIALASVGRLHPVKNFDGLIRAMALLPEQVTLTIWGEGPERPVLEALVASLGLGERVRLPGESNDMEEALAGADVYVQPSKSEGCSFAVAEAMLHSKPVVVTPRGGLPEQVQDGVSGVVAADCGPQALAAALAPLVSDPQLAAGLGEAGRKAAEQQFSMDKWLDETTTAFLEAAEPVRR